MSRTYRKNTRWYRHCRGDFYSCYGRRHERSVKTPFPIKSEKELDTVTEKIWTGYNWSGTGGVKIVEFEVICCDGDNLSRLGVGGYEKGRLHRIDRARYNQALYRALNIEAKEGTELIIKDAFDPWDYD